MKSYDTSSLKKVSILFLYILVIVCASLTSNAVIFKRIADMSLLIDLCNDYKTYLCWQVSSILFSIIQVLMSICLNLSFLGAKKKKNLHHQPSCVRLFDTIGQHIFLARKIDLHSLLNLICSSITKILQCIFTQSYMYVVLHIIREEIFTVVELHGIQKKCSVNDNKTKRYGSSKFFPPWYLKTSLHISSLRC